MCLLNQVNALVLRHVREHHALSTMREPLLRAHSDVVIAANETRRRLNDATAIVIARILIGITAAGHFGLDSFLSGTLSFLLVFFGGIAVGCLAAS